MKAVSSSLVRFGVITLLSFFVFGCGDSKDQAPATTPTGNETPVVTPTDPGTVIKTGMHVLTSLCTDASKVASGCADNKVPYRVVMEVEWQAPAGWVKIGQFDSGALGDITVGVPAGKYRLTKKAEQPATSGAAASAAAQTLTVILDNLTEASFLFVP